MMRRRHTVPSWEEFMALVARVQALESSRGVSHHCAHCGEQLIPPGYPRDCAQNHDALRDSVARMISREGAAPKPDESSASGEGAAASPWFASGETD